MRVFSFRFSLSLFCLLFMFCAEAKTQAPGIAAKSWVLVEFVSGQFLAGEKIDEPLEPASLTKLMTAYLSFSALQQKTLTREQSVLVSENAWRTGMGGSRTFLQAGRKATIDDLLKGMIVQSGNDAAVVLAEAIAGSEEAFAAQMNREAKRLGMNHTRFKNATGLPDAEHFTTARDLATLATALLRDFPEEYARYYAIREFSYNNIRQKNRNILLGQAETGVDGMKTGYTEAAGWCLIASALRGERRLLAIVLGAASDAARASESLKLLNWGYQFFDAVKLYEAGQAISEFKVWKGSRGKVKAGFQSDFILSIPRDARSKLTATLLSRQPLLAPVRKGQIIGILKFSLEGETYGEYPVESLEDVPLGNWFYRFIDTLRLWFA
ncbi:MAG: D-alanyl-D-alanine carboxypeptidase [Zoogloeaceae bacterium]|jgi:D-alanyl-D-alanine carboxypeptidase (penicillin-binding protein 5/6)|nr:D-alanyl-D-alanine carboxypeptidase [Zoogloeaceae bacterium]